MDKSENDTPQDFLTDQEEEKPKQSREKGTGERRETKMDHKRRRKLRKVSSMPPSAEVRRAAWPRLSAQLLLPMVLANSASALSGNGL